jgi:outer membrane protein OmpA-like peptidoglycan-associated protein
MRLGAWFGLGAMALLLPGGAAAQDGGPVYTAEEIADILGGGGAVAVAGAGGGPSGGEGAAAFSAGELAEILSPARPLTRGLTPGGDPPKPGDPGSGVVPDIRVTFGFNSASISPDARANLDELGRAMQLDRLRPLRFVIAGHTDATGPAEVNERLSQRRADAVVAYLSERFQIEPSRLRPVGYGERALLDPSDPANGRNRRVEVRTQVAASTQ